MSQTQTQTQTHKRSRTPSDGGIPSHSHPNTSSPTKRRRNDVSDGSIGTAVRPGPWDNRLRSKSRSYCMRSDSLDSEASLNWPIASPSRTSRKQPGCQAASEDSLGSVVGHFDDMSLDNELESYDHHLRMMDRQLDLKKQVDRKAELEKQKAELEKELEKTMNELSSRVKEIKAYTADIKSMSPLSLNKVGFQQHCQGIQAEMDLDDKPRNTMPDSPDAALSSPGFFENGVYKCLHKDRIITPLQNIEDECCLDDTSIPAVPRLVVAAKPIEKKMELPEIPIYVRFAGSKKGWKYEYDHMDEDLQEYESMLHPSKDAAH